MRIRRLQAFLAEGAFVTFACDMCGDSIGCSLASLTGPRAAIGTDDPGGLKRRVLDSGFAQVTYPATNTFYFAAPGRQVLGIVLSCNGAADGMDTKH
jgi:hypothetical protein